MAVNLKLERSIVEVVGGQEVILENLNHSSTEPIFRQNGYEGNGNKKSFALEFDKNKQVLLDEKHYFFTWLETKDIDFEVKIENLKKGNYNSVIIGKGGYNKSNTGYLYLRQETDTKFRLRFSGANLSNDQSLSFETSTDIITIKVKDLDLSLNGVSIFTLNNFVCNINTPHSAGFDSNFRLGNFSWSIIPSDYGDFKLLDLSFNGLKSNLTYGLGNTTGYYNNQLTVDVNGADETKTIVVTDDIYRHEFIYVDNPTKRQKLWRYYGCKLISDDSVVIVNSDSEGVFRIDGASDFTGGWHGDEEFIICNFYLDGVLLDITTNQTGLKGSILTRDYVTDMLETDNPTRTVIANRISRFSLKYKELEYDLTFDYLSNMTLQQIYLGMSSVFTAYNELSESGSTYTAVNGSATQFLGVDNAVSTNTSNGKTIKSYIINEYVPQNWVSPLLFWVQTSNYNKLYYGSITDIIVTPTDINKCFYNLKFS